jgi:transcriptional regulator with XRE-family HTH domain
MTANPRLDVLRNMLDMSMRQAALGAQIRAARKAKKWKQRELAARIPGRDGFPIDTQTVSRWERGEHQPDLDTLNLVAVELGQPLSYFLPEDETAAIEPLTLAQAVALLAEAATELREAASELRQVREAEQPRRKAPAPARR